MVDRRRKKKPVDVGSTGLHKMGNAGAISGSDSSADPAFLQALSIRNRFNLSWPLARAVAELAYMEARQ